MKKFAINEGPVDRAIRIVAGTALVIYAAATPGNAWAYIGIVPLVTGLAGWCPLYKVLGVNTCSRKRAH